MADDPSVQTMKMADAEVTLIRNAKWAIAGDVVAIGDRMEIKYLMGNTDSLAFLQRGSELKIFRVRYAMSIETSSSAIPAKAEIGEMFHEVPEAQRV